MEGVGERLVVVERAHVLVDLPVVARPVAVVAAELDERVPPLRRDGRRDPDRGRAEPLDVVELLLHAAQVAAGVLGLVGGVVLVLALIVVGGIAVGEAVGQDEVDDLILPRGGGDVQLEVGLLRVARAAGGERAGGEEREGRAELRGHATSGLRGARSCAERP
ncbi:MAG: hypothetical protein QM704_21780 [Anaeromyxobacteraceae bacterium]